MMVRSPRMQETTEGRKCAAPTTVLHSKSNRNAYYHYYRATNCWNLCYRWWGLLRI